MDKTPSPAPAPDETFDALVIGGGPAGLQAALTLARVHRHVLLVDAGSPRNARAAHMHNFLTHDGTPPAEFRDRARRDLAAYDTVTLLDDAVRSVSEDDLTEGFVAETEGGRRVRARRLVLATGVRDGLPDVPGLDEHWGTFVHHCPFCHGHELAGGRVGLLDGPHAAHVGRILEPIADEVLVLDDVTRVAERDGRLELHRTDGTRTLVDGLFVATDLTPAAPHADQLGLARLDSGAIEVDVMGRTSRPGVFAAGDAAHHRDLPMPMASVLTAAAAGLVAGSSCVASLVTEAAPAR